VDKQTLPANAAEPDTEGTLHLSQSALPVQKWFLDNLPFRPPIFQLLTLYKHPAPK
jgi:hypothetical protein